MKKAKDLILPPAVLTVICALIALILGFVNKVTAEPIAKAEMQAKEAAIYAIFSDADSVSAVEFKENKDISGEINDIFTVKFGEKTLGTAVNVTVGSGYGGEINMTVGVSLDGSVLGVEIVNHSETAGLGARIDERQFRDRFIGIDGLAVIGENVDAISGATISSKAVAAGVNAALTAVGSLSGGDLQ